MHRRRIDRALAGISTILLLAYAPVSRSADPAATDEAVTDPFAVMGEISVFCAGVIERSDTPATIVERISSEIELPSDLPMPIDETATLGLFVNEVGVIESMRIVRTSADYYGEIVTAAYERARPFPIMKGMLRDCLVGQNLYVQVFVRIGTRCVELEPFRAYRKALQDELYPVLYSAPFSSTPGRGYVRFELFVDAQGNLRDTKILSSPGPVPTAKLIRAVEASSPFPPPSAEIFETCFAEKPAILRLEVQGSE